MENEKEPYEFWSFKKLEFVYRCIKYPRHYITLEPERAEYMDIIVLKKIMTKEELCEEFRNCDIIEYEEYDL